MGWTSAPNARARADMLTEEMHPYVIERVQRDGSDFYIVAKDPETEERHAFVALVRSDGAGWTRYEIMHESMGPCYYGANARTLAMLSPTTDENAKHWREQCRTEGERRKLAAQCRKPGASFTVSPPVRYGERMHAERFTCLKLGKRTAFQVTDGGPMHARYVLLPAKVIASRTVTLDNTPTSTDD